LQCKRSLAVNEAESRHISAGTVGLFPEHVHYSRWWAVSLQNM